MRPMSPNKSLLPETVHTAESVHIIDSLFDIWYVSYKSFWTEQKPNVTQWLKDSGVCVSSQFFHQFSIPQFAELQSTSRASISNLFVLPCWSYLWYIAPYRERTINDTKTFRYQHQQNTLCKTNVHRLAVGEVRSLVQNLLNLPWLFQHRLWLSRRDSKNIW